VRNEAKKASEGTFDRRLAFKNGATPPVNVTGWAAMGSKMRGEPQKEARKRNVQVATDC